VRGKGAADFLPRSWPWLRLSSPRESIDRTSRRCLIKSSRARAHRRADVYTRGNKSPAFTRRGFKRSLPPLGINLARTFEYEFPVKISRCGWYSAREDASGRRGVSRQDIRGGDFSAFFSSLSFSVYRDEANSTGILFMDRSMRRRNVEAKNGNRVTGTKRTRENDRPLDRS